MSSYSDTYLIDGVDLRTAATRIETAEGLQDTPGTVGDDVLLPGMDGELEVYGLAGQPRRPDGAGRITFNMSLRGVDPVTGAWDDDAESAEFYFARWDELVRMFYRRRFLLTHPRPDGNRQAYGHLVPGESMAPSKVPSSPWFGRFRASVAIPGGHWTSTGAVSTGTVSLATGGTLSLSAFAGATAPCTELLVIFGPGTNPRLTTSYNRVGWNGVIAAGRQLQIETGTGLTTQGSGSAWTPGYALLDYSPGPRLFEVDPSEPLSGVLTHTGGGSMQVQVAGRRRFRSS